MEYVGSPSGSGNPPGKHSPSYTKKMATDKGHFVSDKSYRGGMHVGGIKESAPVVGNQPKASSKATLESRANKEKSI